MDDEPPIKRAKTDTVNSEMFIRKERMFIKLQKLFEDQIELFLKPHELPNAIICCDEEMRTKLMDISERIIRMPMYSSAKLHDVYMGLIFTFYSLLGEQTEDAFDTHFFYGKAFDARIPNKIFLDLTIGDITEADGTNLSQYVRKMLLGLNGGKRRKWKKGRGKTRRTTGRQKTKRRNVKKTRRKY